MYKNTPAINFFNASPAGGSKRRGSGRVSGIYGSKKEEGGFGCKALCEPYTTNFTAYSYKQVSEFRNKITY